MAKSVTPKKPVNKTKNTSVRITGEMSRASDSPTERAKSSGHFEGGAAPRVGSGVKKGSVKVNKPSSVSSGYRPTKAAKTSKRKLR